MDSDEVKWLPPQDFAIKGSPSHNLKSATQGHKFPSFDLDDVFWPINHVKITFKVLEHLLDANNYQNWKI